MLRGSSASERSPSSWRASTKAGDSLGPELKKAFGGTYVVNEGFTLQSGNAVLGRGDADAVAFGKPFIANPDLVRRLRENAALNEPKPDTFYAHEAEGYTDYPALS